MVSFKDFISESIHQGGYNGDYDKEIIRYAKKIKNKTDVSSEEIMRSYKEHIRKDVGKTLKQKLGLMKSIKKGFEANYTSASIYLRDLDNEKDLLSWANRSDGSYASEWGDILLNRK